MKKYSKTGYLVTGAILLMIFLSACAHKPTAGELIDGHTYGFWSGLLHGFIAPFDLIGMLFSDTIVMYAPNNNGAWYAFGFLAGSGGWGFFGSRGARNRKKARRDYGSAEVLE